MRNCVSSLGVQLLLFSPCHGGCLLKEYSKSFRFCPIFSLYCNRAVFLNHDSIYRPNATELHMQNSSHRGGSGSASSASMTRQQFFIFSDERKKMPAYLFVVLYNGSDARVTYNTGHFRMNNDNRTPSWLGTRKPDIPREYRSTVITRPDLEKNIPSII